MHRRRTVAVQPAGQQNAEINVTPLVDVVLVLLIIFMVVTPLLEKDIAVRVPATEEVETADDLPPDQLVVKLHSEGPIEINGSEIDEADYLARMRELVEERSDKTVFFVADDGANYARFVSLVDGAKQAGATTVGMATEKPPAD